MKKTILDETTDEIFNDGINNVKHMEKIMKKRLAPTKIIKKEKVVCIDFDVEKGDQLSYCEVYEVLASKSDKIKIKNNLNQNRYYYSDMFVNIKYLVRDSEKLEKIKRFIDDVYEDKNYINELDL